MNEMAREADRRVGHGGAESPSPALREREGPAPQAWEGEGRRHPTPSPSQRFAPSLSRNAERGAFAA